MTKLELLKNEVQHHNSNGQIHDSGETANANIVYVLAARCIFFTKTILIIDSWIIITYFLTQLFALNERNVKNVQV